MLSKITNIYYSPLDTWHHARCHDKVNPKWQKLFLAAHQEGNWIVLATEETGI